MPFRVNLGGEGEVPAALNQQERTVILDPNWKSSQTSQSVKDLLRVGHDFLIAENLHLPLPDNSFDEVITNNMPPVNSFTWWGPSVQLSEIQRILKSGGCWIDNGILRYTKP
jgi:ubiquinone/menaquinone biosynthesis C-methylase UbiE